MYSVSSTNIGLKSPRSDPNPVCSKTPTFSLQVQIDILSQTKDRKGIKKRRKREEKMYSFFAAKATTRSPTNGRRPSLYNNTEKRKETT
jgi:hypothetical protein